MRLASTALSLLCLTLAVRVHGDAFVPGGVALDTTDDRISSAALGAQCDCSPNGKPYPPAAREMLVAGLAYIASLDSERSHGTAYELLANCTKAFGTEHCVNAEQSLRTTPTTTTLCVYDLQTGVNLSEDDQSIYRQVEKCPLAVSPTATPSALSQSKGTDAAQSMPSSSPSPSLSSTPSLSSPSLSPIPSSKAVKPTVTPPPSASPSPPVPKTASGKSEDKAAALTPSASPASDSSTSSNSDSTSTASAPSAAPSLIPAANQTVSGTSTGSGSSSTDTAPEESPPASVNPGCIAVEHLGGAALQYRRHLRRQVLCARGICATPYHALLVDGKWTSLKALCSSAEEQCTTRVAWVNNLRILRNTRLALAPGIVATPYDVRVPRAASYVAQAALEVIYVVRDALSAPLAYLAVAAALPLLLARATQRSTL